MWPVKEFKNICYKIYRQKLSNFDTLSTIAKPVHPCYSHAQLDCWEGRYAKAAALTSRG